jgi:hypothetical protein
MRMLVVALIAGVVLGFVDGHFLMTYVQKVSADPGTQNVVAAGLTAFLGALWGWSAKGVFGPRPKD